MTIRVEASDRLVAAADDWAEARLEEREKALRVKAEQALLEVEHLVGGKTTVEFDVDGQTISYEPSADVESFLASQAAAAGIDEETLVTLYIELFADVFSEDDVKRPPNAPPPE